MKAKRQASSPKISAEGVVFIIILGVLGILALFLGGIYAIPARFTLPLAIILFWISGAMALWHFGKRRF